MELKKPECHRHKATNCQEGTACPRKRELVPGRENSAENSAVYLRKSGKFKVTEYSDEVKLQKSPVKTPLPFM